MRGLPTPRAAALAFAALTGLVAAFQLALALGAPWGRFAMGGAFPGVLPPAMRVAAVAQIGVLGLLAFVVLARAGVALPAWRGTSRRLVWAVVALLALSLALNLVTPSAGERALWAPVVAVLLLCGLRVALDA